MLRQLHQFNQFNRGLETIGILAFAAVVVTIVIFGQSARKAEEKATGATTISVVGHQWSNVTQLQQTEHGCEFYAPNSQKRVTIQGPYVVEKSE